ncbi:CsiV family protein [methane-oxidizing endosymbiont of Gigantopelta aegis]|uniref:CsiV family protein n=1 Tax=methane-oxidizing endosymbiont of Gigantopelta aegis TaxID=2794938 RepID=UPI0018DB1A8D|nr:CsiV family protein [methane-oxidizing endosymbiont of Gigantopelta aegis]
MTKLWIKYGVLLGLLCLISGQSWAKARNYKIELIVFSQQSSSNEVFDQYQSQIQWPHALQTLNAYSAAGKSLTGIWRRLQASSDYQPLLHVAWVQRIGANRLGTAVRIHNAAHGIDGFFRVQRGNLLHLIADFEYQPDDRVIYHLKEKRRFKLDSKTSKLCPDKCLRMNFGRN